MFSFSPFGYDYDRQPKSFGYLFDDDPFSSRRGPYYVRESPNLFRSSSFRQPSSARCYYQTPLYQQQQRKPHLSDEEDDYDPFSDLFGLRTTRSRKDINSSNDLKSSPINESKSDLLNNQKKPVQQIKSTSSPSKLKTNSPVKQLKQAKELDSQRFDTDNEIIFKFTNYKCENPSGINVTITKDNYIVLKTDDGYNFWKNRLPDNCEIEKASCTCVKQCLSLRLPKKVQIIDKMEVIKDDVNKVMDSNDNCDKNNVKQLDQVNQVNKENDDKKEDDYDPYAPIVEDIIEEDDF